MADCLQKRYEKYRTVSDRVLIADRGKKPMTPENVSRLAKNALDSEGQKVSLMDLRHDWLLRQIEAHGWAYAAKVSGLAVSSLRGQFGSCLKGKQDQNFAVSGGKDEVEYLLWRIVQQEGSSTAGLAIWMCWQLAMQPGEVAALTWDQVDFKTGHIHLPNRDIDMGTRMQRLLGEVWDRQKPLNEPQVFVAPTTGHPIDLSRVSVVSRTAMIRGGLEHFSLRTLCSWAAAQRTGEILTAHAEKQGSLVREDVMKLLHVSENTAWTYLNRLADSGRLEKVGVRYYPKGSVVAPENQLAVVQDYLKKRGIGSRQAFVELLHITPHQATNILKHMVERGELIRIGKRYRLPEGGENKKP
ncbi:hypothetical protein [Dysosmobacter sp.]|uniref:hypothetical protein n=1 Tax=Dysosmobacter sp. TaxID=2591382 RepID=UPI003AF148B8